MHGDFLAEGKDGGKSVGGLALLSAYINQVRKEEKNVLYMIAGDMVQGSLIDSEFKGISTMGIMNYLAPDVVTLGNHEFDYGLAHLLFLEKVANFPVVNANLFIKPGNKRLMRPFVIMEKDGFSILVTGIITEKVMDQIKGDDLIGSFVTLEEASNEVGRICNAYRTEDIDLTVLLTHIGLESDVDLARLLKPEWGVDLIIGGHSHSIIDRPLEENGILIVTAGTGTDQIGRLDIEVDDETNHIIGYQWRLVTVDDAMVTPDHVLEGFIASFQSRVDNKYDSMLSKLTYQHTHPKREEETEIGNLFADALAEMLGCDLVLLASGSIRSKEIGPVVTLKDLMTCFPYNDVLTSFTVTGQQLRSIFANVMRPSNRNGEGECYQVNSRVRAVHDDRTNRLTELSLDGKPVIDAGRYSLVLQGYHARNAGTYLGVTMEELSAIKAKVVSTSAREVLEEWLRDHQNVGRRVEGRLTFLSG
jgi:5'-nucleotidase